MTASEFGFLAVGLLMGVASGAAIVEVIRARPASRRQVRVTVAPDSVPRRASTLSASAFADDIDEAARGGPADHRAFEHPVQTTRSPGLGTAREPDEPSREPRDATAATTADSSSNGGLFRIRPLPPSMLDQATPTSAAAKPRLAADAETMARPTPDSIEIRDERPMVGIPIETGTTGLARVAAASAAVRRSTAPATTGPIGRRITRAGARSGPEPNQPPPTASASAGPRLGGAASTAVRVAPGTEAGLSGESHSEPGAEAHTKPAVVPSATSAELDASMPSTNPEVNVPERAAGDPEGGPCAELRRVADERCSLAARSRELATAALTTLREAQRAYDDHHERADRATAEADPRAIRESKDNAQRRFRHDRDAAHTQAELEDAARVWLDDINRINHAAREAAATATREREAANALVTTIERMTVEADAARISSEAAEEACVLARTAVADCDETAERERRGGAQPVLRQDQDVPIAAVAPPPPSAVTSELARLGLAEAAPTAATGWIGASADAEVPILRLLRGDPNELARIAATLAEGDVAEQRRWQLALAELLEAIIGRAIEASALDFPHDHPFWGPFTRSQARDIVGALASLGYRFDGLGGFADERVPGQRDLSLAVGYAGLDPMRIRHWPNEHEMPRLFEDVTVTADEYLAEAAGTLTLGELVSLLGRRADSLTEVWNAWGRLRPLLLEDVSGS